MMKKAAIWLAERNWILRSGGAAGADTAFLSGAEEVPDTPTEVWTISHQHQVAPWTDARMPSEASWQKALLIAQRCHPAWDRCSRMAKHLHGRNSLIMLGHELIDPVRFVICWTPGGEIIGGTGQIIRMANEFNIPVLNLGSARRGEAARTLQRWTHTPPEQTAKQSYILNLYDSMSLSKAVSLQMRPT